jgi:hypothetical protein
MFTRRRSLECGAKVWGRHDVQHTAEALAMGPKSWSVGVLLVCATHRRSVGNGSPILVRSRAPCVCNAPQTRWRRDPNLWSTHMCHTLQMRWQWIPSSMSTGVFRLSATHRRSVGDEAAAKTLVGRDFVDYKIKFEISVGESSIPFSTGFCHFTSQIQRKLLMKIKACRSSVAPQTCCQCIGSVGQQRPGQASFSLMDCRRPPIVIKRCP